jgi:hypothetical protein
MASMPALSPTGNNITLPGITEAQRPALAGLILHDAVVNTSLGGGHGEGETVNLQLRVVRSTETGLLDFYYHFTPTADTAPIGNAAAVNVLFNLPGLKLTFADFRIDGIGTEAPNDFANGVGGVGDFYFTFLHGVPIGTSTRFFFVSTNAKEFTPTAGHLLISRTNTLAIPGPSAL